MNKHFYLILLILFGVFLIVPLILNENSYLTVFDMLDSEFLYFHLLKVNDQLFSLSSDAIIENVMNGLPRSYFHSEFNIIRVLFYLLPSLYAYHVNAFLVRVIGFIGMLLLTRDYILKTKKEYVLQVAFLFAFIPLYTIYGISVSGMPLLFWAFLNLKNNIRKIPSWFTIFLFPFYSHFAFVAPFVVVLVLGYGLYALILKSPVNYQYWLGIAVLIVLFILSEVSMIYSFFLGNTESQRQTWLFESQPLQVIIKNSFKLFIRGHYHVSSFFAIPIIALIILTLIKFSDRRDGVVKKLSIAIVMLSVIAIFFSGYYLIIEPLKKFQILTSFQFRRFTFLTPLILFAAFAFAIEHTTFSRKIILVILFSQFALIAYSNNELKLNFMHTAGMKTDNYYFSQPSFKHFFEPDLFSSIKEHIGTPQQQYRVVCIGLYPSIAQYNGFYTLDSYQNNYPLSYKEEFLKIIDKELEKDSTLKYQMTNWGSKCYIVSAELWKKKAWYYEVPKSLRIPIHELSIRTELLKAMGCRYIFSAIPIENYRQLGLTLDREFISDKTFWDIYLYKIN